MNLKAKMKHKAAGGNRQFTVCCVSKKVFRSFFGKQISLYSFILKNTKNNVKLKITQASYVARMLHLEVLPSK